MKIYFNLMVTSLVIRPSSGHPHKKFYKSITCSAY